MAVIPNAKTKAITFPHQKGGRDDNVRTDVGDEVAQIIESYLQGTFVGEDALPVGYIPFVGGWTTVTQTYMQSGGYLTQYTDLILVYTLTDPDGPRDV